MRGKHANHAKGPAHPRWSEEKMVANNGYVKLRVGDDHPLADPNGYAYEHLVIWAAAGRPLPSQDELIHHKNENKTDNRLSNLELKKRIAHSVEHHKSLTDEQVLAVRRLYADGAMDMSGLAASFGVGVARISKIIRGETRRSVGGPICTENRARDPNTGKMVGKSRAGRLLDGKEYSEFPR